MSIKAPENTASTKSQHARAVQYFTENFVKSQDIADVLNHIPIPRNLNPNLPHAGLAYALRVAPVSTQVGLIDSVGFIPLLLSGEPLQDDMLLLTETYAQWAGAAGSVKHLGAVEEAEIYRLEQVLVFATANPAVLHEAVMAWARSAQVGFVELLRAGDPHPIIDHVSKAINTHKRDGALVNRIVVGELYCMYHLEARDIPPSASLSRAAETYIHIAMERMETASMAGPCTDPDALIGRLGILESGIDASNLEHLANIIEANWYYHALDALVNHPRIKDPLYFTADIVSAHSYIALGRPCVHELARARISDAYREPQVDPRRTRGDDFTSREREDRGFSRHAREDDIFATLENILRAARANPLAEHELLDAAAAVINEHNRDHRRNGDIRRSR